MAQSTSPNTLEVLQELQKQMEELTKQLRQQRGIEKSSKPCKWNVLLTSLLQGLTMINTT